MLALGKVEDVGAVNRAELDELDAVRDSTSTCSTGFCEISSANALRRIIGCFPAGFRVAAAARIATMIFQAMAERARRRWLAARVSGTMELRNDTVACSTLAV